MEGRKIRIQFFEVKVGETVERGGISEFTMLKFVRGDDTNHSCIVGNEFFGVGGVDGEAIFSGHLSGEIPERDVADNPSSQENHAGRVEVDGAAETSH